MSYSVVLWDFGGVITASPFDAFNRFEDEHGIPRDFIRSVNARDHETNAWAQFESSRISVGEFDELFAAETAAAGHAIRGCDMIALLDGEIRPRMVTVLERCKRDYKIACLTNNADAGKGTGMARTDDQAEHVKQVMRLFDAVIESSKEGIRKPDPKIYRLACERLQVEPQAIVFLDDLGINLKPARALGMTTIKVVSEQQAIHELGRVLDIAFD